jgi:hypothetical protein
MSYVGLNIGYDDKTIEEAIVTTLLDLQIDNKCKKETAHLVCYHYVVFIILPYW